MRGVILRIREEGEGGHFRFSKNMFLGTIGSLIGVQEPWADPESDRYPSFPVPDNPTALLGHEAQVKDPRLLALARLGNLHYWIVLSLLHLSYASEVESQLSRAAVRHMTDALYPLSQEMSRAHAGMPFDPQLRTF